MKRTIAFLICVFAASTLLAQNSSTKTELSIGVDVGLPLGDFNQTSRVGLGGTGKFAYNFTNHAAITAEAGYISFGGKTVENIKLPAFVFVPIKVGFRYTFEGGFYGESQLGLTLLSVPGSSTSGFTYAINVGYRMTPGIDASAHYEGISKNGSSLSFIGLRVAYSFFSDSGK